MRVHAPAKLNLCLYLGPRRPDGLHELCSLFEPLALSDLIERRGVPRPTRSSARAVDGANLAERALAGLRGSGWRHPPLRIEIEKRIPIAAGLGGGSADAAAVLRLAAGEVAELPELAAALGADVPSQLDPGPLVRPGRRRAGRAAARPGAARGRPAPGRRRPQHRRVFEEADRLGLGRDTGELDEIAGRAA